MSISHTVTLTSGVTGEVFDVWDEYAAHLSMLQPGSPFTFSFWYSDTRRTSWQRAREAIRIGDRMLLAIDGAVQLCGYVDEVTQTHRGEQGAVMTVSGMDLSGPAMKWHADPALTVRNRELGAVLNEVFAPLGIGVFVGAHSDDVRAALTSRRAGPRSPRRAARRKPVDLVHPQPGETMWSVADKIVRRAGYMMWCAPIDEEQLAIIVDLPDYESASLFTFKHEIIDGVATPQSNVLHAEHKVSLRSVPTEVNVYANAARGDSHPARMSATVGNIAIADAQVMGGWVASDTLTQPMHVTTKRSRTQGDAGREGQRLISDAMARARMYTCTVQGHGQRAAGAERTTLYAVNSMARVLDTLLALDEDMLITDLAFNGSRDQGQTTTLTLSPRGAIVVTPDEP